MTTLLRGRFARGLLMAAALYGAALSGAGVASAHPTLLFADPAADTATSQAPQAITLVFNETVSIGPKAIVLLDRTGRELPMGVAVTERDGKGVTSRMTGTLAPGTYTVRWRVTGTDGDLVEEQYHFGVGYELTTDAAASDGSGSTSWPDAVLRWLLFVGFAVAFGGLIGQRITTAARRENPALPELQSQVTVGLAIAIVGVLGLGVRLVADAGTMSVLWRAGSGPVVAVEAGALLAALIPVAAGRATLALIPLLGVVTAEGVRSHADAAAAGWGALLTGIHLAAVAIWVGALLHTVRAVAAWWSHRAAVRWVLTGYMRLAVWTFAVVIATGAASALVLIPLSQLLSTDYGRVLAIKLGLVTIAAGLALSGRLIQRSQTRLPKLPNVIRVETVVLVLVLAASATLVSTPPVTGAPVSPAPALTGVVLPLGTLAGQIGVSATASDGYLVVRLTSPRRGDYYATQPDTRYTLSGRLDTKATGNGTLTFRSCGTGCFVADAQWRDGDNVLTLRPEAEDAAGATVSLLVPWPAQPGDADLARATAALRDAGNITVYETVTSDTRGALPEPTPLDLAADFFLSQEPYAAGTAPIAVRISRDDEPVRLALGYPAASITVQLALDTQGRINHETLAAPHHLVIRRFVYSEHD